MPPAKASPLRSKSANSKKALPRPTANGDTAAVLTPSGIQDHVVSHARSESRTMQTLTLARLLQETPPPLGVDLAFFDLEDSGRPGHPEEFCQGSLEMARRWISPYPDWVLVLDMVGSDRTEFGREQYSQLRAPELLDLVFQIAEEKGFTEWNSFSSFAIVDDHLPWQSVGVPAAVLVGFNDPNWHTVRDDPMRTSPRRLGRVGEVVLELIYGGYLSN